jgi:hypothetical protein
MNQWGEEVLAKLAKAYKKKNTKPYTEEAV